MVISDTHSKHEELPELPDGDVLIHCGDYSVFGEYDETLAFLNWFSMQKHAHKIIVPGNHEVGICPRKARPSAEATMQLIKSYTDINFLVDQSMLIDGIKFYGTPWCNGSRIIMGRWGFFEPNEDKRRTAFSKIDGDTDVLISHAPPLGILDTARGMNLGCEALLRRVQEIRPLVHVFGHIHESYGLFLSDYTQFYNCANMDGNHKISNPVHVITI